MLTKRWSYFFMYLIRVFILVVLLAVVLPKLATVCNIWMSARIHDEQKPIGNPLRVEAPGWSEFVIKLFPITQKEP
jgi:hypothetical protein